MKAVPFYSTEFLGIAFQGNLLLMMDLIVDQSTRLIDDVHTGRRLQPLHGSIQRKISRHTRFKQKNIKHARGSSFIMQNKSVSGHVNDLKMYKHTPATFEIKLKLLHKANLSP